MEQTGNLVKNLIERFRIKLAGIYPDQEIRQLMYMLFAEFMGWQKTRVHLSLEEELPETVIKSFRQALEELSTGKPIQYILHQSWFNGTLLKVDSNVLIPRPETEELCSLIETDHALWRNQSFSILDIGTGSGCIAIELKKHFLQSFVTAIDNSDGALDIAGSNARENHCEISFFHADILNQMSWKELGQYHVIVSNPPYITASEKVLMHRNVTEFEPDMALFVSDQDPLLFYKAISDFATTHLLPSGRLYFEINERFGKAVSELLHSSGFEEIQLKQDFHGKDRFVSAILKAPSTLPG